MAESSWLYPAVETMHLVAMILLVGSITVFDLRLLGLAMRRETVSHLAVRLYWMLRTQTPYTDQFTTRAA